MLPEYGGAARGVRPNFDLEIVIRRLGELWGLTFAVLVIDLVMLGHNERLFSQSGGSQGCNREQIAKTLGKASGRDFNSIVRLGVYTFITTGL